MTTDLSDFSVDNDSQTIISLVINDNNITVNGSIAVKRDEKLVLLEIGILSLIFLLIVFANSCVLIALQIHKHKMNRMYYFLQHLSISDMITAFFNVLPQLAWEITHRFYGGNILCKTIKYLQIFGPYLSSYVLVMTAIDRYQAICNPLSNCKWTPGRSKLMITMAWIISSLCCSPQLFIFSYQQIPGTDVIYDCWGTFPKPWGERIYVTWYAVSIFIIPFIILVVTHYHICREIWINLYNKRKSFKISKNRERVETNETTNKRQDFDCDSVNASETNSEQTISAKTLVSIGRTYRFKSKGKLEVNPEKNFKEDYSPRSHSIHGLSRAKIKTVKITVVVILCYIMCSTPFICVQLWAYWVPTAQESQIWNGPIIAVLMLLPSLNSCVNPWIYLYFNQNLVTALKDCFCRKSVAERNAQNRETQRSRGRPSIRNNMTPESHNSIRLDTFIESPDGQRTDTRISLNNDNKQDF